MTNELASEAAEASTTPDVADTSPVLEQTVEPDANDPDASSESDDVEPESVSPKSRAQERIEQLVAKNKETEANATAAKEIAEYWRQQALKEKEPVVENKPDPKPRLEDFEYDQDKWADALTDWADRQIDAKTEAAVTKSITKQRTQSEQEAKAQQFKAASDAFASEHPDYNDVAYNPALPLTKEMFAIIQESDKGPALVYELGKNIEKARAISQLPAQQQAMALGRMEASLSQPAPKPQPSKAPEPPNPVTDGATPSVDPSKMSIDAWMKWRADELRSKRS